MKHVIFFVLAIVVFISCNQSDKDAAKLSGTFKYLSFHHTSTPNNESFRLVHYLAIDKSGDYKLIYRHSSDSTGYYYGYIDTAVYNAIKNFVADTSLQSHYVGKVDSSKTFDSPTFLFDYITTTGEKKVTFLPFSAPPPIVALQEKLEAVINSANKKQMAPYNIDSYLKKVMIGDTVSAIQ
ncbi:MAG: hypothetical protein ACK5NK_04220 [Niabella sp.]